MANSRRELVKCMMAGFGTGLLPGGSLPALAQAAGRSGSPTFISGIYPHLSVTGIHQSENGIGAVVPWAGRLWFITYFAGMNVDGAQRLYELDDQLNLTPRGVPFYGGSIASRMIHAGTGQLIIGPYFIDEQRRIRQIPVKDVMPMHLSAVARHLDDPNRVLFVGLAHERSVVDVSGTEASIPAEKVTILPSLSAIQKERFGFTSHHGKGLYSGHGRVTRECRPVLPSGPGNPSSSGTARGPNSDKPPSKMA